MDVQSNYLKISLHLKNILQDVRKKQNIEEKRINLFRCKKNIKKVINFKKKLEPTSKVTQLYINNTMNNFEILYALEEKLLYQDIYSFPGKPTKVNTDRKPILLPIDESRLAKSQLDGLNEMYKKSILCSTSYHNYLSENDAILLTLCENLELGHNFTAKMNSDTKIFNELKKLKWLKSPINSFVFDIWLLITFNYFMALDLSNNESHSTNKKYLSILKPHTKKILTTSLEIINQRKSKDRIFFQAIYDLFNHLPLLELNFYANSNTTGELEILNPVLDNLLNYARGITHLIYQTFTDEELHLSWLIANRNLCLQNKAVPINKVVTDLVQRFEGHSTAKQYLLRLTVDYIKENSMLAISSLP